MHILVTGANGFIGKNLTCDLELIKSGKKSSPLCVTEVFYCDTHTTQEELKLYCEQCDAVVHLAGVNRPLNEQEFFEGNTNFTIHLIQTLQDCKNHVPIIITSSIQAELQNAYGISKKEAEEALMAYHEQMKAPVFIYRLPNVFGKWCKPNYNSVVATFCYNLTHNLPLTIHDSSKELTLVYIDDVVGAIETALATHTPNLNPYQSIDTTYTISVGELAQRLTSLAQMRQNLSTPNLSCELEKKLHATLLSYYDVDNLSYPLKMNVDPRGSFTEILKTASSGQFSVNITKPHITKGNHWHHTKNEKFLVVSGQGVIRFRKLGETAITEYRVSGEELRVVDIPPGYTHNIENVGETDLITFMWANESFNPNAPDTYFQEV